MSAGNAFLALFIQPEYGIPLLLLLCSLLVWWGWESRLLPPKPAPYAIRPYWMLDSIRLLHEALSAGQLGPTIQATYTWLSREFVRKYGVTISRAVSFRGLFIPQRIPDRHKFVRAVHHLQSAFLDATYAENVTVESWLGSWRRPRAKIRAQQMFLRALNDLEELQGRLATKPRGAEA
jgi:hypothetical protein